MKINVNGIKINYLDEGAGEPLILIHGMSDNSNLWLTFIPYLFSDFRVFAIDLRGHGQSSKPPQGYSLEIFNQDLVDFLDNMKLEKVNLIGHSLGAAICQEFALKNSERVKKLILLSPFFYVDEILFHALSGLKKALIEEGYYKFFDEAVKLVNTPDFIVKNVEIIEQIKMESQRTNPPEIIEEIINACLMVDMSDEISNISPETLIITGSEDNMIPMSQSQMIHEQIKNSELVIMKGVGHNLFVSENLERLSTVILKFLG
ncbi:alpha/beta fold hydrolase [Methanobacterium alcaliphilum]|uniref:alpha/beta fold hydrolase n=1 Tax=Methanobacterium alcaliphilum TaxID=392018 RepID=UPI00200B09F1|nr:alpha/beta hydrolase [Methanobacterium alcaliphilum]MCK9151683.1 alpha/beta hydrolase [Methanobacterium alcaliphilum]